MHSHQNAIRILDRVDMTVVLLKNLHGSAHLFRQKDRIHAFAQSERRVGMSEAIGRAFGPSGTVQKFRINEQVSDQ
jgi:hypothetical protein